MRHKMSYVGWLVWILSFSAMAQSTPTNPAADPSEAEEGSGLYLTIAPRSQAVKQLYLTSATLTALSLSGSLVNTILIDRLQGEPSSRELYTTVTLGAAAKTMMSAALLTAGVARYKKTGRLLSLGAATAVSAGVAFTRFALFTIPAIANVEDAEPNPKNDIYAGTYGIGTLISIPVMPYFLIYAVKEASQKKHKEKSLSAAPY